MILITEITLPDHKSTCYRCKAEFYKDLRSVRGNTAGLGIRAPEALADSDAQQEQNKVMATILGGAIGFALGYWLVTLMMN